MNEQLTDLLIKCCQLSEISLRDYIQDILPEHNFTLQQDDYISPRKGDYAKIHNLLAIRGDAKICVVSHTDVCRDHAELQGKNPNLTPANYHVNPVIKEILHLDKLTKVIQDQDCLAQVGGDDRVGVAIALYFALYTDLPLGLLFTTDEEIGLISAKKVSFPELMEFDLLVQIDRGNQITKQIVTKIHNMELCDFETVEFLIELSEKIGRSRIPVQGYGTDVYAIKVNNKCQKAINLTCGYHNSRSSSPLEYIVIEEAEDTMEFVQEIIKSKM